MTDPEDPANGKIHGSDFSKYYFGFGGPDPTCSDMSLRKQERMYRQRKGIGFDESETWSLDYTIAKFILPRLKYFRDNHVGFPDTVSTDENWCDILDMMICAFEFIIMDYDGIAPDSNDHEYEFRKSAIDHGMRLFAKHIQNLWD